MSRSVLYDNNLGAYHQRVMDQLFGKRDFGDPIRPVRTLKMEAVPAELQKLVRGLVGNASVVDQFEVDRKLSSAVESCMREDRGIFGRGLFGLPELGGGNGVIESREQARAMKKNELVKPVLDYIYEVRGEK